MTKAKKSYSVFKRYRRRQSTYFCPNFRKWSKVLIFLKSMFSRHLVQIYLPIIDSIILLQSFDFDFLMIESLASSKDHVQRNLWKAFLQTLKLSWLNLSNPSLFPFLHTSWPLLPGVEGLGGDEPEQTPLVPWLQGRSLLLLDSEVIFILSIAWRACCRVLKNMLQYFPQISFNMVPTWSWCLHHEEIKI